MKRVALVILTVLAVILGPVPGTFATHQTAADCDHAAAAEFPVDQHEHHDCIDLGGCMDMSGCRHVACSVSGIVPAAVKPPAAPPHEKPMIALEPAASGRIVAPLLDPPRSTV